MQELDKNTYVLGPQEYHVGVLPPVDTSVSTSCLTVGPVEPPLPIEVEIPKQGMQLPPMPPLPSMGVFVPPMCMEFTQTVTNNVTVGGLPVEAVKIQNSSQPDCGLDITVDLDIPQGCTEFVAKVSDVSNRIKIGDILKTNAITVTNTDVPHCGVEVGVDLDFPDVCTKWEVNVNTNRVVQNGVDKGPPLTITPKVIPHCGFDLDFDFDFKACEKVEVTSTSNVTVYGETQNGVFTATPLGDCKFDFQFSLDVPDPPQITICNNIEVDTSPHAIGGYTIWLTKDCLHGGIGLSVSGGGPFDECCLAEMLDSLDYEIPVKYMTGVHQVFGPMYSAFPESQLVTFVKDGIYQQLAGGKPCVGDLVKLTGSNTSWWCVDNEIALGGDTINGRINVTYDAEGGAGESTWEFQGLLKTDIPDCPFVQYQGPDQVTVGGTQFSLSNGPIFARWTISWGQNSQPSVNGPTYFSGSQGLGGSPQTQVDPEFGVLDTSVSDSKDVVIQVVGGTSLSLDGVSYIYCKQPVCSVYNVPSRCGNTTGTVQQSTSGTGANDSWVYAVV